MPSPDYIDQITLDGVTKVIRDTTLESKQAASGGTDISLVTTGEKFNWNAYGTSKVNVYQGTTETGKVLTVNSSGNVVPSSYTLNPLYRQFWSSTDSISLSLAEDGKTYYVWCAGSGSGNTGSIGDESYGAFIFISNGHYMVQHKGSEITVDETSSILTITSSANIAMAIIEV